jgi:hypothetical protein
MEMCPRKRVNSSPEVRVGLGKAERSWEQDPRPVSQWVSRVPASRALRWDGHRSLRKVSPATVTKTVREASSRHTPQGVFRPAGMDEGPRAGPRRLSVLDPD